MRCNQYHNGKRCVKKYAHSGACVIQTSNGVYSSGPSFMEIIEAEIIGEFIADAIEDIFEDNNDNSSNDFGGFDGGGFGGGGADGDW